jgi:HD-GYP domain-containing protein (c-di-GMP phosphodiesterase class II)
MGPTLYIVFTVAALVGAMIWSLTSRNRRYERVFQKTLESTQVRLDRQTSQFNILVKALPSLQAMIASSTNTDAWKPLCLDEARAMVRADGASYWAYHEGDQKLQLELNRGADVGDAAEEMAETLKKRSVTFTPSAVIVPLIVCGNMRGAFRLIRRGDEKMTQHDADLVDVFLKQVALSLDNREMIHNREKFYLELVQTLADVLDSRDAATEGQTRRARRLARATARELSLPDEFIYYLEFAALMHDIGKIAIDESLLKKPGKLTPQEFEILKKHPEFGHKILAPVTMLAPVAPMVLYHQEWYNGKGYPEGLAGEEIPLGARIVGVLDAWGAMTCDRPWRPALTVQEAVKELRKGAGTQFDPKVIDAFIAAVEKQGLTI